VSDAAPALRLGAVVLAAGSGTRFGGGKLLAPLRGRPLLQWVLDAARDAELASTVVVLGADAPDLERAVDWHGAGRVVNPRPGDGLASSLRIGFAAAARAEPPLDGAFVLLGDQPRVSARVIRLLADAASEPGPDRPLVIVPVYDEDTGPNPALVLRPAWPAVETLDGDRGLGPFIASHPNDVRRVRVAGVNPDVDTLEDLRRL
jgi:CTP:molybdopterin cytidylyltransferase MocA